MQILVIEHFAQVLRVVDRRGDDLARIGNRAQQMCIGQCHGVDLTDKSLGTFADGVQISDQRIE